MSDVLGEKKVLWNMKRISTTLNNQVVIGDLGRERLKEQEKQCRGKKDSKE